MTTSFDCDICGETNKQDFFGNKCCGITSCINCSIRVGGQCYVCDKDELNSPMVCDMCGKDGTQLTLMYCNNPTCDNFICETCNKFPDNNAPFRTCSWRHTQELFEEWGRQENAELEE